ncbi:MULTISPECIES: SpoVR family protein [Kordiimonas]|uniref:SpoVR family protein n=1 Tax=Kordiimonas TaxID=288021 RepID=UPI002579840E|nr:SpoVR family protein [Kordiimonas sp. UBA4487]
MPGNEVPFRPDETAWTMADLQRWNEKILRIVDDIGLNCFTQEFEVCDHEQMLGYMAYHGMPAHYPHWSFGKSFERQKTLYDLQLSGLPYEMVINSDPSVAYLMRGNSLCLQILTMAHVYGHNDFFKNNFTFRHTDPTNVLNRVKVHGNRIRDYMADPSIGVDKVERILDACHALSLQVTRNPSVKRHTRAQQEANITAEFARNRKGQDSEIHDKVLSGVLDEPLLEDEEDLLLLVRDRAPDLSEWERDIVNIVREDSLYFLPQIETKTINEGWASFWHHQIMNALDLPHGIHMEFLVRHHQVIRPHPGGMNPYHIGFMTWRKIAKEHLGIDDKDDDGGPLPLTTADAAHVREEMFKVREVDRDVSFLRRFLDEKLMRELDLFEYGPNRQGDLVVSHVSDDSGWKDVKATLLANMGMGGVPVIKGHKIDARAGDRLTLKHEVDEVAGEVRELEPDNCRHTMEHMYALWRRPVELMTTVDDKEVLYLCDEDGFRMLD